ncbi:MAG: AI-2E family transporter [Xanthomonadales bacterium]|nr:AI-2E family transporter [Xanthomonadales bacterium]
MNPVRWFWLVVALIAGLLVWLLGPVLTPFLAGALVAYLGDPLVDRLERTGRGRWRLGRTGAVVLVFALLAMLLAAAVLLLVPMLERQVLRLVESLPGWLAWLQESALPWLGARLGIELGGGDLPDLSELAREHWQSAGGVAAGMASGLTRSGMAVVSFLINLVLIPVVAFYLMRDWDLLVARIHGLLPRASAPTVTRLARESDQVLGAFFRGQLLVMLALAVIYSVGLAALGVDLALLIGIVAGLVSFVPYLGTFVGVAMAVAASVFQFGEAWHLVAVLALFAVGNLLEGMVLQPWLIGDRIGLHPVAVIFAVLAGGQLFGFTGVLLALPVAAVLVVLLRFALQRYRESEAYRQADTPRVIVEPGATRSDDPPASV